ncbi:hypothetical protein U9M48_013754 [Paspalum notatum var. saurae]|uniref:Uncharacterized protein n=1 Tax=Paspalum notatum var. saurae TaxID=547442 RepID=A0AAQ3T1B1_PASNO
MSAPAAAACNGAADSNGDIPAHTAPPVLISTSLGGAALARAVAAWAPPLPPFAGSLCVRPGMTRSKHGKQSAHNNERGSGAAALVNGSQRITISM